MIGCPPYPSCLLSYTPFSALFVRQSHSVLSPRQILTRRTETRYGLGLPIADRPSASLDVYTKVNFAGRPIYQIGISFFKIALLISYLRLLKGTDQKTYRYVVFATIALVFLGHLGCALSLVFACNPVQRSWNPHVNGTCLAPGPSFTAYAVVTIVSDIVVAILPLPVLFRLNIRMAKKLGLIGIFLLGLFTTICSILRYTQINRISTGDGNSTMLILWGTIEFNVGVSNFSCNNGKCAKLTGLSRTWSHRCRSWPRSL